MRDTGRSTQLAIAKRVRCAAMQLEYRLKHRFDAGFIEASFVRTKDALAEFDDVFTEHAAKAQGG